MKKHEIEIPVLLPSVPDEKDHCVNELIKKLAYRNGVDKVHVVQDNGLPKLCFHYDPSKITLNRIENLARRFGAELTEKYGHRLIEVRGIRHVRHARQIEDILKGLEGVIEASVSGSGFIRLEFENSKTSTEKIYAVLEKNDITIVDKKVSAERYIGKSDKVITCSKTDFAENTVKPKHEHNHQGGVFGKNTELIFSIICGILLVIGFGLSFIESIPSWVSLVLYIGAYFFGGYNTAREAFTALSKGKFDIDFLMLVAATGAAILGVWAEGALLLFLFSLAHALEHYAMGRARNSIAALADLTPKIALRKQNDEIVEIGIDEIQVGDILMVRPHTKISADGYIVSGASTVNQAPITGESIPVDKVAVTDLQTTYKSEIEIPDQSRVFSGTINGNSTLEIKVLKETKDSTLSRLINLVNEAQTQKSPTQRFTDKFEKYFVPSVLGLVVLLFFAFLIIDETFSQSFYRAMAVLVAASPCALAISTPSAVLSGVARAARGGVLIKGGRPLEDLGSLTAIAFDKTGTLTEGKPKLTRVIPLNGITEAELLKIAVAVEDLSDHPLAKALVRDGKLRLGVVDIPRAEHLEAVMGKGIKAQLEGDEIFVGNLELYNSLDANKPDTETVNLVNSVSEEGNTIMLIRKGPVYIGIIGMMDVPRPEAKATLQKLKDLGIKRMIMLTGDNQNVADNVGKEIGMTDVWGGLLPEEKVEAVKRLMQEESKVAMVGDGVNDAPAMANSTVGIAMGAAGSDVALETADVALMADKLETLPFAIGLSRKSKQIIKQNLFISLGMVAILIPLTVLGIASIGPAVLLHEGSTVLVVFNALRLLAYKV